MNANTRIQWLHKKISSNSYPNAQRLAERFGISHRQAQRDLDFLKKDLSAPIAYDNSRKGFYYTERFTLPVLLSTDNDDIYLPEAYKVSNSEELAAEESIIQMQIPYTAVLEIKTKLTALELSGYVVGKLPHDRYVCEFHSVEKFTGLLLSVDADYRIIEPEWLREKMVAVAKRFLSNNGE